MERIKFYYSQPGIKGAVIETLVNVFIQHIIGIWRLIGQRRDLFLFEMLQTELKMQGIISF